MMDDVVIDVRAVVLRINRQYEPNLNAEELYERARGFWVMQPHDHRDAEFAVALAGDVLREVYRIDSWTRIAVGDILPNPLRRPDPDHPGGRANYRWYFTGMIASDAIRKRLIGRAYHYRSRNPVQWVNC